MANVTVQKPEEQLRGLHKIWVNLPQEIRQMILMHTMPSPHVRLNRFKHFWKECTGMRVLNKTFNEEMQYVKRTWLRERLAALAACRSLLDEIERFTYCRRDYYDEHSATVRAMIRVKFCIRVATQLLVTPCSCSRPIRNMVTEAEQREELWLSTYSSLVMYLLAKKRDDISCRSVASAIEQLLCQE